MGKSFKRFDKDDVYHEVKRERQRSHETRDLRHHAREINEEVEPIAPVFKNYTRPNTGRKPYKGN